MSALDVDPSLGKSILTQFRHFWCVRISKWRTLLVSGTYPIKNMILWGRILSLSQFMTNHSTDSQTVFKEEDWKSQRTRLYSLKARHSLRKVTFANHFQTSKRMLAWRLLTFSITKVC